MTSPTYKFVAFDLDASLDAARKLWVNRGSAPATSLELSILQGFKSAASGSYLTRLANVRAFGFLDGPSSALVVSDLAKRILSPEYPEDATAARIEAFENIPLFKAFLSRYHGQMLPPESGMANALNTQFGINADKCSFVLTRLLDSAEQAGLFATTGDRTKMVRPTLTRGSGKPAGETPPPGPTSDAAKKETARIAAELDARKDPNSPRSDNLVDAILDHMPSKADCTEEKFTQWVGLFTDVLRVFYGLPKETS